MILSLEIQYTVSISCTAQSRKFYSCLESIHNYCSTANEKNMFLKISILYLDFDHYILN